MDNQEVVYSDAVFIAAEERLSMQQECSTGICAKCRFWRVIEFLRGRCSKRGYNISCSHSGCSDYSEE